MMKLAVLWCVVAAATARAPVYFSPAAVPASPVGSAVPLQQPFHNYRGPLSLAPGQPATILAADGRPLDTLEVNLDRSAHFVAKALDDASHVLKKRSVNRLAVAPGPVGFSAAVAAGNVGVSSSLAVGAPGIAAAVATNPINLAATFPAGSLSVTNPLVGTPIGLSANLAAGPLAFPTTLAAGPLAVSAPLAGRTIVVPSPVVAGTPFVRNF